MTQAPRRCAGPALTCDGHTYEVSPRGRELPLCPAQGSGWGPGQPSQAPGSLRLPVWGGDGSRGTQLLCLLDPQDLPQFPREGVQGIQLF